MLPRALLLAMLLPVAAMAGCLEPETPVRQESLPSAALVGELLVVVHDALGRVLDAGETIAGRDLSGLVHAVGAPGAEPTVAVTSDGTLFFQAMHLTLRSSDHGRTWTAMRSPLLATGSSDPYVWIDPVTDRVFQINQGLPFGGRGPVLPPMPPESPVTYTNIANALFCAHIAWSDDKGATWLANPVNCGLVPGVDHIKVASGPWTDAFRTLRGNPSYPTAVYFAYNKAFATGVGVRNGPSPDDAIPSLGGWMTVSFDGGVAFPLARQMFGPTCAGGLHGDIAVGPAGELYVPARNCPAPLVARSFDNGLSWSTAMVGEDVGVPEQQKNPAMAVDAEGNVYLAWVAKDNRLHLSMSRDRGETWSDTVVASPPSVGSAIWPAMVAGDAGRIAIAYVGTEDSEAGPWEVANETRWHLYVTTTTDALSENPTFATIRATHDADPVQRGTLCVQSNKCKDGNRNLLDFIGIAKDSQGRVYVAFADGCVTPQCLRPDATPLDSRSREGTLFVQQSGPSLLAAVGALSPPGARP
ncbi:MAG TPA: sialidase family protein [Candidatus Thermoplasmatota archaeon]|nr:sialidase family protein [Candidatus Thermoplasmatota archaeon]